MKGNPPEIGSCPTQGILTYSLKNTGAVIILALFPPGHGLLVVCIMRNSYLFHPNFLLKIENGICLFAFGSPMLEKCLTSIVFYKT